jgi:GNAT superfamily N-acetyltransferase
MTTVITTQEACVPPHDGTTDVVTVKPIGPADLPAVVSMVGRCSLTSLFHRFHGPSDGLAYTRALFGRKSTEPAFVAWNGVTCIGVASLGRDDEGIRHVGVLVEDAWQRRGVGSLLVAALLDQARAEGAPNVHADVMGEDRFLVEALRRSGPLRVSIQSGTFSVDIDLAGASVTAPVSG